MLGFRPRQDKRTGFALRGQFMREYLDKRPFYKENYVGSSSV